MCAINYDRLGDGCDIAEGVKRLPTAHTPVARRHYWTTALTAPLNGYGNEYPASGFRGEVGNVIRACWSLVLRQPGPCVRSVLWGRGNAGRTLAPLPLNPGRVT